MIDEPLTLADFITACIGIAVFVLMFVVGRWAEMSDHRQEADRVTGETLHRVRHMKHDETDG